jgi:rhodanese-related sulfurtransferase
MYMIEINSKSISPAALAASLDSGDAHELLDVHTPPEYSSAHVPGARLIPLGELKAEAFLAQQKPGTPIHVLRQAGARAKKAIELFEHSGCGDCDIRLWAGLLKQLQPIPHFPAHLQDSKPVPSCKLFKFPTLDAITEQA